MVSPTPAQVARQALYIEQLVERATSGKVLTYDVQCERADDRYRCRFYILRRGTYTCQAVLLKIGPGGRLAQTATPAARCGPRLSA